MSTTYKDSVPADMLVHQEKNTSENKKGIENHKQAVIHHEAAALHHRKAIKYHEEGNHERAYQNSLIAYGHHAMAGDLAREDLKHHAVNN